MAWKRYTCSYRYRGESWVFEIIAESMEDADRRLDLIKHNGTVDGETIIKIGSPTHAIMSFFERILSRSTGSTKRDAI